MPSKRGSRTGKGRHRAHRPGRRPYGALTKSEGGRGAADYHPEHPTDHSFQLHPHEFVRWQHLQPGEELLLIRPVVPQPDGAARFSGCNEPEPYYLLPGEVPSTVPVKCCYRPGDVLVWSEEDCQLNDFSSRTCEMGTNACIVAHRTHDSRVARVECKMVREVTAKEWGNAGWQIPVDELPERGWRQIIPEWWNTTHGPEYAWERDPFAWMIWVKGAE